MIGLSKSTLAVFKDCKRCFWLSKNKKIERPRGPFPSIVRGLDNKMKQAVESAIASGQPMAWLKEIHGAEPFADRELLKTFRNWRTFKALVKTSGREVLLWGELDDLIEFPADKMVAPWDFKSNGEERDDDYFKKYNQLDADVYDLILGMNGLVCTGDAYFTSMWPAEGEANTVHFNWRTVKLETNPEAAVKLAVDAIQCLEGSIPGMNPACEFCKYVRAAF